MPTQAAAQWGVGERCAEALPGRARRRRPAIRSATTWHQRFWLLVGPNPLSPALAVAPSGGVALAALVVLLILPPDARAAEGAAAARPGAYCPLPEPGQKPVCLAPAEAKYGDFFAAVRRGEVSPDAAAAVEADLAGSFETEDAYLALSSLSYGYWRLAEQVSVQPDADPALHARLTQWNSLLVDLYGQAVDDPSFRAAVREAATDLQRRTPTSASPCPQRYPGGCQHTDELVRALAAIDDTAGVRSPLGRLLERVVGSDSGEDTANTLRGDAPQ